MSASDTLAQIRDDITALLKSIDRPDATVDDLVDVGSVLSAIATTATEATDAIKNRLRAEALQTLNHAPGKAEFAAQVGHVIVTVPPPRMTLLDTADIGSLQMILGEEFGSFFEGRMTYAPRKDIAEKIIALPEGPQRDALLAAVVEKEQTPRVAFSKV